ncbi:MAG: CBS domain-containing protein [Hyphomicrobiaceae bacterium]
MTNRPLSYIVKNQKPVVLPVDATVAEACRTMCEQQTGSVLVTDESERLVGIFTGRDAVRMMVDSTGMGDTPLGRAMTPNPVVVAPSTRAIDALRIMKERGFRHLPVVEGNTVTGVVSLNDFKGMELEEFVRQQSGAASLAPSDRGVGDIVRNKTPVQVATADPIQQACSLMRRHGTGAVLIVDDTGRLAGIFTGRDAVRALAAGTAAPTSAVADVMTATPTTTPSRAQGHRSAAPHERRRLPPPAGGR